MKAYTTKAGACRAARVGASAPDRPIIRILNGRSTD